MRKTESTVVERLLLDIVKATDRQPQVNVHPGHVNRVLGFCRDEMLRIAVSGRDPLIPPAESRPLTRLKQIKVTATADCAYEITSDWGLRRLRQPFI